MFSYSTVPFKYQSFTKYVKTFGDQLTTDWTAEDRTETGQKSVLVQFLGRGEWSLPRTELQTRKTNH